MQRQVYIIRIALLIAAFLAGFTALGVHFYHLQVSRHPELLQKAQAKYTASRTQSGIRGEIYDVGGNLLAANLAGYDILAEPRRFQDRRPEEVAALLASLLPVDEATLKRRFFTPGLVEVVVARNASLDQARQVRSLNLPGIRLLPTTQRYYPKGHLFANIIGFVDFDGHGAEGVERVFDAALRPGSESWRYERSRIGERLDSGEIAPPRGSDGARLHLTIHEPIQSIVEEELMRMVEEHRPLAAYAIMAEPRTGAIMAMVQYPNFDPNDRSRATPEQWRNRIVGDGFEPGSIMKGVSIAGALDYGLVGLHDRFDCERGLWFHRGRSLRDAGQRHGELPVWQIVQKSSNIGTAKIALEMGEPRMFQVLRRFGFGQTTGIELPHEGNGIFRPLDKWDGLTLSRISIGHGIVATPLQMVQAYCALANDGAIPQIHLVDRIEYPDGRQEVTEPRIRGRALRPGTARRIAQALATSTGPEGTGRRAAVEGFQVAGKTGTAQKVVDGEYSSQHHIASFIGFVPAENPAFVLLVVADEPSQGVYYGGTVAGPPFSRIAEKTLRHLQVAPAAPRPPLESAEALPTEEPL